MISPGLRIGRYEVGKRLGKGGFGVVHVARDVDLDRDVAIKVLKPEYIAKPQIVQRFLKEARAAAKIGHAGIVTVFECSLIQNTGTRADGNAYIAMELLVGESLGDRLLNGGRMSAAQAIAITRQLAAALGAAHTAGIVHRDLKPDNVFLVPDAAVHGGERVKILDFGVAKLMDPGEDGVNTHSQMMLGTPKYMSPEQARAASKVDHRSDLYTLGCMVFEMMTGRGPFTGDAGEQLIAHQKAPPPSARAIVATVPASLDALIKRMLAKSPDDRPQSMNDVVDALTDTEEPDTMVRAPLEPTPEPRNSAEITTVAEVVRPPPRSLVSRQVMIAVAASVAVVSMTVVYFVMHAPPKPAKPAPVVLAIDAGDPAALDAVEITADASTTAEDPTSRLRLQCTQAQDAKKWDDLITCGETLKSIDKPGGDKFYAMAHEEQRAEASLRTLETALMDRRMMLARSTLDLISSESVYRREAEDHYSSTADDVRNEIAMRLRNLTNCKTYDKVVAGFAATVPSDIIDDAQRAAPCNGAKVTAAPKDPPKDTRSECANYEELTMKGAEAFSAGRASEALAAYEIAYRCRKDGAILRYTFGSACKAKRLDKARVYWRLMSQAAKDAMLAICANNGIYHKDLDPPE